MSGTPISDSWTWDRSNDSGYMYPAAAHLPEGRNTPEKIARPWPIRHRRTRLRLTGYHLFAGIALLLIGAAVVMAMLTAGPLPDGPPVAIAPTSAVTPASAAGGWPGMNTAAPTKHPDPYRDAGNWRVGIDLPAGRYRVTVTAEQGGYWARCSDNACVVGDGRTGLLANAWLPAGSPETILLIKTTDRIVVTSGVRLIPA